MLQKYQKLTLSLVDLVNRSLGRKVQTLNTLAPVQTRNNLIEAYRMAHQLGLCAGTMGELSLRIDGSKLLITPSKAWPESLEIAELILAGIEYEWIDAHAEPPAFLDWHRAIYASTDAQAILFSQPAAAIVLGRLRRAVDLHQPTILSTHSGGISWAEPETGAIVAALKDHAVVLIREHGMITRAGNINEAVSRSHSAERLCMIVLQEALFMDLDKR
ncbi:MAG: class II aldolase/adducin family protein, partial [Anaerolineales bacterium]